MLLLIKTGVLIAYFATIVSSEGSLKDLYRPPSFQLRTWQSFHKSKERKPIEYHLPDRHTVEFNINNEKIQLNLSLSTRDVVSHDIPVWIVKSKLGKMPNYAYELLKDTKEMLNGQFYVDNEKKAVLFARYNGNRNKFLYDGVIGEGTTRVLVYSIPNQSRTRTKRANEEMENQIFIDSPESFDDDYEPIIIEQNGVELTKLNKPLEILYPKMLLVVDYKLFKYLNFDVTETVRYVATYWNVVDQKYANIDSPKIQIVVTGIVIVKDEEALNNIYSYKPNTDECDMHELLNDSRLYFSQDFVSDTGFKNYDAIMIMTGLKMKLLEGIAEIFGLTAKLGGICTRDYNIAITTDKAQYNTLIAIHELGHLLNLSHDFTNVCEGISFLFDSFKTSVMTAPSNGTNIYWSECSLRLLKEFSTLKAAECLRSRYRTD